MQSKLSDAQGQSFFWEPVNKDIPETGFTQIGKTAMFSANNSPHDQ
jgi:hypothetical protein